MEDKKRAKERPFEKGQEIEIEIIDMSEQGRGIGKSEGFTFFVKGAVYGDKVKAVVTKVKKNYGFAQVLEILEESSFRRDFQCPYVERCGGCSLAGLTYEGQLKLKEKQVEDKIKRIAGIDNPLIREIVPSENQTRYRNKAVMAISQKEMGKNKNSKDRNKNKKKGKISKSQSNNLNLHKAEPLIGFYQAGSRQVLNVDDCLLQAPPVAAVAGALRQFIEEDHITIYNDETGKGLLRHLIVRVAEGTGDVMVTLVINGKCIPNGEKLVTMLDDAIYNLPERIDGSYYGLESVMINIDKTKDSETKISGIYGNKTEILAGKSVIEDVTEELKYEISPLAFYQVNSKTTEKLYDIAMDLADIKGGETVLDLYCGVGTIGLKACKRGAGKVIGIESVKPAVIDANRNAVINDIIPARYVTGKAEEELPKLLKGEGAAEKDSWLAVDKIDVAFIDPPRKGCEKELLDAVVQAEPERIVYVSCDPGTLARDIAYIRENGYEFVEAVPVDMFPQTVHVESVVLMTRVSPTK